MSLGLQRGYVSLEPHSIEWEISASVMIELLKNILKDVLVDVQHIGSTSIRTVPAKPIIDIAVGVFSFERLMNCNDILLEHGIIRRWQFLNVLEKSIKFEKKILYIEDDLSLIEGLKYTLEKNGFLVDNARTVKEARQFFKAGQYDLLLLDVTLPDGTGFDICQEVRKTSAVPIIFLTASDEEISIVKGLDMGGDDYITKPFKLGEVLSRINALMRRYGQFNKSGMVLESNGIRIDLSERVCWKGGQNCS